jgi:undecaprenyl-diphosphatase
LSKALAVAEEPVIVACSLLVLAWGWYYRRRRTFEMGRALLISYACSGILVQILKHLFGRARPRVTDAVLFTGPTLQGGYDSFPSGHTTVAFCCAYALSQYLPRHRHLWYAMAVVAGMARIESASHFFSDVAAGAAMGVITGKIIFAYVIPRLAGRDAAAAAP